MSDRENGFYAIQDARWENDRVVKPEPVYTDLVEVPPCGCWIVTWEAEHPERGRERGGMFASKNPHRTEQDARNVVSEVLWGRGYTGSYQVEVM